MTDEGILNAGYFHWLCKKIGGTREYSLLLMSMFRKGFYGLIPHDENREDDGLELRREYWQEEDCDFLDEAAGVPCSVLEMMIALAERISDLLESNKDRTEEFFWTMVDNLGMNALTDDKWDYFEGEVLAWNILNDFVNRNYSFSGIGSLFPLDSAREDQRNVEIWYQMNTWLIQNGYI